MRSEFTVPTLLLDKQRCLRNMERMAIKARDAGVRLRPHFKTHQSRQVGHWFREMGIRHIATSSLGMAEYFAQDGWQDITVAFPANLREEERILNLARTCDLNLLVLSVDVIDALEGFLDSNINVYLKVDVGTRRTGIHFSDVDVMDHCVERIMASSHLSWSGFLAHAGHTYSARTKQQIADIYRETTEPLIHLKERYLSSYPDIEISYGDTPSCSAMESFDGLDEIRPGNYVFYDCMQEQIGVCSLDDIAVAMVCPVVAVHEERNEVIVYGGGIHFGKDAIHLPGGNTHYGIAVEQNGQAWTVSGKEVVLKSLSQEHGVVAMPRGIPDHIRPGATMTFVPVHSCMTAQYMGGYHMLPAGERADHYAAHMH